MVVIWFLRPLWQCSGSPAIEAVSPFLRISRSPSLGDMKLIAHLGEVTGRNHGWHDDVAGFAGSRSGADGAIRLQRRATVRQRTASSKLSRDISTSRAKGS